jgi:hypothetical protein
VTGVQILGGPHDGLVLEVPGQDDPPVQMRVLDDQHRLVMDHPARRVTAEDQSVPVLVLTREYDPSGHPPWRYRWPPLGR